MKKKIVDQQNQNSEAESKNIEVSYTKAKLSKRVAAFILDLFMIAIMTFTFYALTNMGVQQSSFYKERTAAINDIKIQSGLYVTYKEEVVSIVTYVESDEVEGKENKKNLIGTRLEAFYQKSLFFSDSKEYNNYQTRKLEYTVDNVPIFEKSGGTAIEKVGVDPAKYLTFYEDECDYHAVAFLYQNEEYANLNRTLFLLSLIILLCAAFLTYSIFLLILPLTAFKRGRQTIGMKISKVAYINAEAVNVTSGKYVGRFFFSFFYYVVLNFVGFLIPTIVAASLMYGTKTNQTVNEYVFNDYVVDVTNQDIYLDYFDYIDHKEKLKFKDMKTTIERRF